MQNRIEQKFKELALQKKCAFMPFLVAGDPDFKKSLKNLCLLSKYADLLEIGFPFSDPIADGPVIQQADNRALQKKISTKEIFRLISSLRKKTQVPITVLVYANLVYAMGVEKFYKLAKSSGIDGVLVPDLPIEESIDYVKAANSNNICPIFLVTQTTDNFRFKKIEHMANGFLYLVSVLGVTGERKQFSQNTFNFIKRIKSKAKLPIVVGFGISNQNQIKQLKKLQVNGVIVASALVKVNQNHKKLKQLLISLKNAC